MTSILCSDASVDFERSGRFRLERRPFESIGSAINFTLSRRGRIGRGRNRNDRQDGLDESRKFFILQFQERGGLGTVDAMRAADQDRRQVEKRLVATPRSLSIAGGSQFGDMPTDLQGIGGAWDELDRQRRPAEGIDALDDLGPPAGRREC